MPKQLWTPEEVLERIREIKDSGRDLTHGAMLEMAPRLVSAAQRYFGSWRRAVEEAGIDYSSLASAARNQALARRTKWSEKHIVERIRELVRKREPLQPTLIRRKHPDLYAAACSPRYFDGWGNALKAAGVRIEPSKPGRPSEHTARLARWKAELLLESVCQIVGPDCSANEIALRMRAPRLHAEMIRWFGSWQGVIRAIQSMPELGCRRFESGSDHAESGDED